MTNLNEIILKEGKYGYFGGIFDVKTWDNWAIEKRNFIFAKVMSFMTSSKKGLNIAANYTAGHGFLTDRRFIFGKSKSLKNMAVGANVSLEKDGKYIGIPLENIIRVGKGGPFEKYMSVETTSGEYLFYVSKFDEWEAAFNEAIAKRVAEQLPTETFYCTKCGDLKNSIDEVCADCGYSQDDVSKISNLGKAYITKMWLFGLFGTLGLHYFASGRNMQGMVRLIWCVILWPICILLTLDAKMREMPKLLILFYVMLLLFSLIDILKISIGKFRDVNKKFVK